MRFAVLHTVALLSLWAVPFVSAQEPTEPHHGTAPAEPETAETAGQEAEPLSAPDNSEFGTQGVEPAESDGPELVDENLTDARAFAAAVTRYARRSSTGLFRHGGYTGRERHAVDVEAVTTAGYDNNNTDGIEGGLGDPRIVGTGGFSRTNAKFRYWYIGDRSTAVVDAGADLKFYESLESLLPTSSTIYGSVVPSYYQRIDFSTELGQHTKLSGYEATSFSALSGFSTVSPVGGTFDVELDPQTAVVFTRQMKSRSLSGSFTLQHRLSRTGTFSVMYQGAGEDTARTFVGEPLFDSSQQGLGGLYERSLTRHASLRLGYSYRRARYWARAADDQVRQSHGLDVGVGYSRALSFSRRTRIGFSTGSEILVGVGDGSLASAREGGGGHDVFFAADAWLEREIGRSWLARGRYVRQTTYAEGFADPVLADALRGSLTGSITRQMDADVSAEYSRGTVGVAAVVNDFWTASVSGQVRYALTRSLALYGEYTYYSHKFGPGVAVPIGFARDLDRNVVRIGIAAWLPLIRRSH